MPIGESGQPLGSYNRWPSNLGMPFEQTSVKRKPRLTVLTSTHHACSPWDPDWPFPFDLGPNTTKYGQKLVKDG